jgi:hypothetical protein
VGSSWRNGLRFINYLPNLSQVRDRSSSPVHRPADALLNDDDEWR